jgi:tetratricopeptide (TPR) repeat protein
MDAPDSAFALLSASDSTSSSKQILDGAICDWLERRRKLRPSGIRQQRQRFIREVGEVFEIVGLLGLASAAVRLRQQFVIWNDFVSRLSDSPARDARAEYWRMLALTQPLVAQTDITINTQSLSPLWMMICREAGAQLPREYLAIGLLGLRRVPQQAGDSEIRWLAGLAQWALHQNPSIKDFTAEWRTLKTLYPRAPARWRRLIRNLLSAPAFKQRSIKLPAWWEADGLFRSVQPGPSSASAQLRSPSPSDAARVIEKCNGPWSLAEPELDSLLTAHRRYVAATGDAQFFVRAIHVLGTALLGRRHTEQNPISLKVQAMAREGLAWDDKNTYLWSLWANAFAFGHNLEAAELVYWESNRRFPRVPQLRNQLAFIISLGRERTGEAEALLREGVDLFPDDAHARVQLAGIFMKTNRHVEAIPLLKEAISISRHASSLTRLATALIRIDQLPEAEALLRDAVREFADQEVPHMRLASLLSDQKRQPEAEAILRRAMSVIPDSIPLQGQFARLLTEWGRHSEAEALLHKLLDRFPESLSVRAQLAALLSQGGRVGEGEALLREKMSAYIAQEDAKQLDLQASQFSLDNILHEELTEVLEANSDLRSQLAQLLLKVGRVADARKFAGDEDEQQSAPSVLRDTEEQRSKVTDPFHGAVFGQGATRRLSFQLQHSYGVRHREAVAELKRLLETADDIGFAYVELLAARQRVWASTQATLPPFGVAFEHALATEDSALLDELAKVKPRLTALTMVAKAVLGDSESATMVQDWLGRGPDAGEEPAVAALRGGVRAVLRTVGSVEDISVAVRLRRPRMTNVLYTANEITIGNVLLVA